MSPGGCPLTCGTVVAEGATHSCLLALTDTPAQGRGGEGKEGEGQRKGRRGAGERSRGAETQEQARPKEREGHGGR